MAPPADQRRRHPLAWFVIRRLAAGIATLFVVSVLVFAGTEVLPGDAAGAVLGKSATPRQVEELRHQMGLDRSAVSRYFEWLGGLLTGDLGNSAAGYAQGTQITIWSQIKDKIGNSLILALIVTAIMIPLSLVLGVLAAVRAGRATDHAVSISSLAIISLPEFIVGSLLILLLFSWLNLLPPVSLIPPGDSPLGHSKALVLPVLTLLGVTLAASIRMIRAGMIEALRSDYVQMARLNGFRERTVVWRYALRNGLAPSVQVFAQNIQYLIGGIIVTEYLFSYPGLGKELVDAVGIRDVQGGPVRGDARRHDLHRPQHRRRPPRRAARAEAEDAAVSSVSVPGSRVRPRRGGRLRFLRTKTGMVGAILFLAVLAIALFGPFFAPYAPDKPIGIPFSGPSSAAPFGTDFLGRDVLSRVLWGGRSVIWLAGLATLIAYVGGVAIGLLAGYSRSLLDPLLMRSVDVLLAFPALLFILVVITGAGTSKAALVICVALVQMPLVARDHPDGDARTVRARLRRGGGGARRPDALDPAARDPAEHRPARSWPTRGLRFTFSIILVASVNFLSLGLQPPDADWGLMISENRDGDHAEPVRDPRSGALDRACSRSL